LNLNTYALAFDGAAVDGNISEVCKEFLGTVLRLNQLEQLGRIVDELRRDLPTKRLHISK
jgi:hypothetical protein